MRSSKAFNSRQMRAIESFAVSHQDGGGVSVVLLARKERPARRSFDRFFLDLDEADAKRHYLILGRKFATNPLVAQVATALAHGVGIGVGSSLTGSALAKSQGGAG